jgi:Zn-dependent protease
VRGFRPGFLGAPLRMSVNAVLLPLLVAIGVFRRVNDTTFVRELPSLDGRDPGDFDRLSALSDLNAFMGDVPVGWALVAAAVTAVVVVLSILVHEVGHVVAVRRADLRVDAIDLGFAGGWVTFPDDDTLTAGKLAAIAAAGPAATALLAAASYGALAALGWSPFGDLGSGTTSSLEVTVRAVLAATFSVNLFCLVLNLLPIRPLDGHHLLVAGRLWRARHAT